jgi:tetratricopeptide (TPR) repeat protein
MRAAAVLDGVVDPQTHEERWHLLAALVDTGRWRRAHDVVRQAPAGDHDSLTAGLVRALADAGEYEQALGAALSGIVDEVARDGAVAHVAGAMAAAATDPDAFGYAERALVLARTRVFGDRTRSSALRAAGEALHRLGRTERAVEALRLALTVAGGMVGSGGRGQEITATATALAAAGHPEPGIAAINGIPRGDGRTLALATMAKTLVAAGDTITAAAVLETAPVPEPSDRELGALASVTIGLVEAGRPDRAEALARARTAVVPRNRALVTVASALARAGGLGRAAAVLDGVEAELSTVDDPDPRPFAYLLVWTAEARTRTGRPDRAVDLLSRAADLIGEIGEPEQEHSLWLLVVDALVQAGAVDRAVSTARTAGVVPDLVAALVKADDLDRAEAEAAAVTDPGGRDRSLARVVRARIAADDLERAAALARSVADAGHRAEVLTALARAQTAAGARDTAVGTLRLAEAAARESGGSGTRVRAVVEAVLATCGLDLAAQTLHDAETAARDRPDALVDVWCTQGRLYRAVRAAQEIVDPLDRCRAMTRVAVGYRAAGRAADAGPAAIAAGVAAEAVADPERQATAWAHVASAWAVAGRPDRARESVDRAVAAAGPAPASAVAAEIARARVAIGYPPTGPSAEQSSGDPTDPDVDPAVADSRRAAMAAALARSGEVDRALSIARSVLDGDLREHAVTEVAVALARTGTAAGALALLSAGGS